LTSKFDLLITAILSAIIILVLAYPASATITWYDNHPDCTVKTSYTTDTVTSIQVYAGASVTNMDDHADWFWFAPGVVDDSPDGSSETYLDANQAVSTTTLCSVANVAEGYSLSHTLTTTGDWTVHVYIYKNPNKQGGDDNGAITVTVSAVPEFPFGPAIVIVISGFIYFVMRKRIKMDRRPNHGKK
jgi:hypothetical protein